MVDRALGVVLVLGLGLAAVPAVSLAQNLSLQLTIPVGASLERVVITPDGSELYVSNADDNTVSVVDTNCNTVTSTIPVASQPSALAVSPDGKKVYVGNNGGGVSVIDTVSKAATATIGTPGPVRDLALTPDGSKLYVARVPA